MRTITVAELKHALDHCNDDLPVDFTVDGGLREIQFVGVSRLGDTVVLLSTTFQSETEECFRYRDGFELVGETVIPTDGTCSYVILSYDSDKFLYVATRANPQIRGGHEYIILEREEFVLG